MWTEASRNATSSKYATDIGGGIITIAAGATGIIGATGMVCASIATIIIGGTTDGASRCCHEASEAHSGQAQFTS